MYDITALGELLIDFTEHGVSSDGQKLFEQNPGGAVANVVVAAAKCGRETAFIGKVGRDMHGLFLQETLNDYDINTSGLSFTSDAFTTLAFVALSKDGERDFSFARNPGADTCLELHEVPSDLLKNTRILHVGSLSLTDEPARSATYHAVEIARRAGATISFDPNYRPALWSDQSTAINQIQAMIEKVHILKLSVEEAVFITGISNPLDAALELNKAGTPLVMITLGSEGAVVCVEGKFAFVPSFDVPVIDTTGAGDAFCGVVLHKFLECKKAINEITIDDAADFLEWGNAAAALCIGKRGAIPGMHSLEEIEKFLNLNEESIVDDIHVQEAATEYLLKHSKAFDELAK